jgi:hypothetical protein
VRATRGLRVLGVQRRAAACTVSQASATLDVLHVVVLVERGEERFDLGALVAFEGDRVLRLPDQTRGRDVPLRSVRLC